MGDRTLYRLPLVVARCPGMRGATRCISPTSIGTTRPATRGDLGGVEISTRRTFDGTKSRTVPRRKSLPRRAASAKSPWRAGSPARRFPATTDGEPARTRWRGRGHARAATLSPARSEVVVVVIVCPVACRRYWTYDLFGLAN